MAIASRIVPVEEFDRFVLLPENAERMFEYIGGEIVEAVSNNYSSEIGARFLIVIGMFVLSNDLGRVTGADGGYQVSGERYIPDVAFVSKAKQPEPPDLAVEVLSPTNDADDMRIKVVNYLRVGTVVWVVDPINKRVEVYVPPIKRRSKLALTVC